MWRCDSGRSRLISFVSFDATSFLFSLPSRINDIPLNPFPSLCSNLPRGKHQRIINAPLSTIVPSPFPRKKKVVFFSPHLDFPFLGLPLWVSREIFNDVPERTPGLNDDHKNLMDSTSMTARGLRCGVKSPKDPAKRHENRTRAAALPPTLLRSWKHEGGRMETS